jgi:hypothetical protein
LATRRTSRTSRSSEWSAWVLGTDADGLVCYFDLIFMTFSHLPPTALSVSPVPLPYHSTIFFTPLPIPCPLFPRYLLLPAEPPSCSSSRRERFRSPTCPTRTSSPRTQPRVPVTSEALVLSRARTDKPGVPLCGLPGFGAAGRVRSKRNECEANQTNIACK